MRDVDDTLRTMPQNLAAMYSQILGRIDDSRQQQYARDILMWLTYARRPLYVQELEWVIAFEQHDRSFVTVDPRKRLQNGKAEIFAICHSLVGLLEDSMGSDEEYVGSQKVLLAHSTVKDYITSTEQKSPSPWLGTLESEPSHRLIAQSLLAYLKYLSGHYWSDVQTARWSREFSLAWYAVHVWPEHAGLSGPDSFDESSNLGRQMARLMFDEENLIRLITLFEPHKAGADQLLEKALQDLKIVWYHTSRMRLGRMVHMSFPPRTHDSLCSGSASSTRETRWIVRQKLGRPGSRRERDMRLMMLRDSRQQRWQRDRRLRGMVQSRGDDWESDRFLDLDFPLPPDAVMTSFWEDSDLAVAVVKSGSPGICSLECQLPMVIHVSFLEMAEQAPEVGGGVSKKS